MQPDIPDLVAHYRGPRHAALARAAARAAVGIGAPLALGTVTGHRILGMLIGLGALWAVSQDGIDPATVRLPRMSAIAVTSALGFLLGATVLRAAGTGWPVWTLLAATGAVAGAFEIGGPTAGAASLHLLLGVIVASGLPLPGPVWAPAAEVLGGALWHTALTALCEPGSARAALHELSRRPAVTRRIASGPPLTGADRLRAAVMLAVLVGAGSVLASGLQDRRTYWLPLAVAFIFRPSLGSVSRRALARTAGTATGALIAAGLAAAAPGVWPATVLAAVCGAATPLAARRGYGPMCAAFTPIVFTFLDMADDNHGLFAWRALDTAIAGAIVIAIDLVWWTRVPSRRSAAVLAHAESVIDDYSGRAAELELHDAAALQRAAEIRLEHARRAIAAEAAERRRARRPDPELLRRVEGAARRLASVGAPGS